MECDEYRVIVMDPAEADLIEIHDYISEELSAPIAAHNFLLAVRDAINQLAFSPHGHPKVRDERLAARGYRWVSVKNYVAFYSIDEHEKLVYVERVLYGRRDWANIL